MWNLCKYPNIGWALCNCARLGENCENIKTLAEHLVNIVHLCQIGWMGSKVSCPELTIESGHNARHILKANTNTDSKFGTTNFWGLLHLYVLLHDFTLKWVGLAIWLKTTSRTSQWATFILVFHIFFEFSCSGSESEEVLCFFNCQGWITKIGLHLQLRVNQIFHFTMLLFFI